MRLLLVGFLIGFATAGWYFRNQQQGQGPDEELRRRANEIAEEAGEVARRLGRQ